MLSLSLFLSAESSRNEYKELNLSACHIGDGGIYRLSQCLCAIGLKIEKLNVVDNRLTKASMSHLVNLVKHLQVLHLEIGNNPIQCVDVISNVMFFSLVTLNLWGCEITAPAGAIIAKMSTFLIELNVGNNKLGDVGAVSISVGIKTSLRLEVLNLSNNDIGPDGAVAIIDALSSNISLVSLNMSNNAIGEEGATAIAKTIESNRTLKRFLLWGDKTWR